MTTERIEIESPVPVSLTALVTGLLVGTMGCNPGPSFECQPRTLETQEFSRELFVGTWSNCPYHPTDDHGIEPYEGMYCTFHVDGSLTLRKQYSSRIDHDTDKTWEVRLDEQFLIIYEDDDLVAGLVDFQIGRSSVRGVPENLGVGPEEWQSVTCSGPDW